VIIALAANSGAQGTNYQLPSLTLTVFKTLQAAGRVKGHHRNVVIGQVRRLPVLLS
jgi:hypothetical protein